MFVSSCKSMSLALKNSILFTERDEKMRLRREEYSSKKLADEDYETIIFYENTEEIFRRTRCG